MMPQEMYCFISDMWLIFADESSPFVADILGTMYEIIELVK